MTHYLKYLLHVLFMPGMRGQLPPDTFKSVENIAHIQNYNLERNSKKIAVTELVPKVEADKIAGAVVFCHPLHKSTRAFALRNQRVEFYLKNNFRVFLFDFNGFGESDFHDYFYSKDAEKVIEHAQTTYAPRKMILHGMSFGSFHMIPAMHALQQNSSVVFENTSRSLYDYWKKWWHTRLIIGGIKNLPIPEIRNMDVQAKAEALNRPDIRGVFMACENDVFTPAGEMRDLHDRFTLEKEFVVFPCAKHLEAPRKCGSDYFALLQKAIQS
jgi:pimeloyl-ACP methyl ester carboxylesterase